jgi:predicted ATPase
VAGFAAPEVGDVYARALVLSEQIGDVPERFVVVAGLEAFYSLRGDLPTASALARRLLQLGEESGDRVRLTEGNHAIGCNRLRAAEFAAARAHLEQAIALYGVEPRADAHRLSGHDPKVCCLGHLACVLWVTGYPTQARSCAEEALGFAETLAHPPTLALALVLAAAVHLLRGEPRCVEELTSRTLAIASEYGLAFWTSIASVQRGWALAELGHGAEAVELLQGGIRTYCAIGAGAHEVDYRALAVRGYARIGRIDDARRELAGAFDAMERNGERYFESELQRIKGELLVREDAGRRIGLRSRLTEAEKCFREAIGIACRRQAKSLELRAAISLSRLLRRQERHAEERTYFAGCTTGSRRASTRPISRKRPRSCLAAPTSSRRGRRASGRPYEACLRAEGVVELPSARSGAPDLVMNGPAGSPAERGPWAADSGRSDHFPRP